MLLSGTIKQNEKLIWVLDVENLPREDRGSKRVGGLGGVASLAYAKIVERYGSARV